MLDLEDSMVNEWEHQRLGVENVLAALRGTLTYADNLAVYVSKDSACMLRFYFRQNGVELVHVFSQSGSDCGFPPGVLIGAFFRKTSSGIPVIQDLSGHKVAAAN